MKTPPAHTPDTLTSADMPALRAQLLNYASEAGFSDQFRAASAAALDAIDEAVAADAAVSARLQLALDAWKLAADAEIAP